MSFTNSQWGYKRETTWATSIITANADVAYKLGLMVGDQIHPTPVTSLQYNPPAHNTAEAPSAEKKDMVVTGKYNFIAQNGVFLEWILGKSSTPAPAGGIYTHTITTPADGSLLPSFTTHLKMDGSATAWNLQTVGVKASSVKLLTDANEFPSLLATVEVVGKKTDTSAVTLDVAPALPATATTTAYVFNKLTREFDSAAISGLISVELDIIAGTVPVFDSTYDGATYDGNWAAQLTEAPKRLYRLKMSVVLEDDTFWTEMIAMGNTKNLVFKWVKSTDDYIQITCTDVHFLAHPVITRSGSKTIAELSCEIISLSVEVKDKLIGGFYGE